MKLNMQSYTIDRSVGGTKQEQNLNKNTICMTVTDKFIFIGSDDGCIDILNSNLKPICVFQSHTKSFDILQNAEVSETIQAMDVYDNGMRYTSIYALNDNLLKVWNLRLDEEDGTKIKKKNLENVPNFFQYTANSLNIRDGYMLASDFLDIKYLSLNNLKTPIILVNKKPVALVNSSQAYNEPLNLINKSKFLDHNTIAYSCTNGNVCFNDLRASINSTETMVFDHKLNLEKTKYSDLLHSVSDFHLDKATNLLYARNLNSVASFDIRKGFLDRKIIATEEKLFDESKKLAYERYSLDLWNNRIITGMQNIINILDKDHHIIKLPVGGANKFIKNIGENRFATYYLGKVLFFKLK